MRSVLFAIAFVFSMVTVSAEAFGGGPGFFGHGIVGGGVVAQRRANRLAFRGRPLRARLAQNRANRRMVRQAFRRGFI